MENLVAISSVADNELSFAALLESMPNALPRNHRPDDIVVAHIVNRQPHGFGADVGGKTESFIANEEAGDIEVGQDVEVCVLMGRVFDSKGQLLEGAYQLSRVRVIAESRLSEIQTKNLVVEGEVVGINVNRERKPVGLNVHIEGGIPVFVPGSQLERRPGRWDYKEFLGSKIPLVLSQRVQKGGLTSKAVFSHRDAVARLRHQFLESLSAELNANRGKNAKPIELEATIVAYKKKVTDGVEEITGALARVNEYVTGFIYKTQVSFNRDVSVQDALKIGDKVKVAVQEVDLSEDKLKLSAKAATVPHDALSQVNVGDELEGKVFLALERPKHGNVKEQTGLLIGFRDGMVGHAVRNEILQSQDQHLTDRLPIGAVVKAVVTEKKTRNGQLEVSLSPMREPIYNWLKANIGQVVDARVGRKAASIGVFVSFCAPAAEGETATPLYLVDGLVHESDLKANSRELTSGETVKVTVLSVKPNGDRFRVACRLA
jgi:small subunit ribosomal protein S1